jgi:BirA family transcriptional regulator, biotin operon repressor / biotin---[acetyl-CoA-carboxylase] ligase
MADALDPDALRAASVTSDGPWRSVEHHDTIGSTNVRAAALDGPWRVVVADHQSQGRGRLARRWEAPPGASVAVSATVPVPAAGPAWLPLVAGLAVVQAVEAVTGLRAELKWPNDVLLPDDGSRKVCGILCELVAGTRERAAFVVVGTGLNVSQTREELPVPTATSLSLAGADAVDRTALVAAYLRALARRLGEPAASVREAYRSRCTTIGRLVTLSLPDGATVTGEAVGVDADGRLLVDGPQGRVAWAAGDVVHARPPAAGEPPVK